MGKMIWIVIFVIGLFTGCLSEATTQQTGYADPNALVESDWLAQHVDDSDISIIAAHITEDSYIDDHIKGSVFLDYKSDIVDLENPTPNQMAPREKVEDLLRSLGIRNSDTVVVYDNTNNMIAARVFNVLKFYGHVDVRLLNGGRKAWIDANGELTVKIPNPAVSDYTTRDKNSKEYVTIEYVYNNLDNPDVQIVDVRPTDQYTGEKVQPGIGRGGGHIPGAINAPGGLTWNDDKTIKSYEELKAFYDGRGVSMDKKVVVYCHNGMLASYSWYVLTQLVGHPNVAVYDGSSLEWTNHPDTPLVKGPDPGAVPTDLKGLTI
jgi:thiosulfate/3-mercaptopyruvate sulfurtransferase